MKNNPSAFILFKTEDEKISVDVRFEEETVWLSQEDMAVLFGKARSTITEHIQNVFKEGELNEEVACRNFRHTTQHGAIEGKTQEISVKHYNLDVIISVKEFMGLMTFPGSRPYLKDWAKHLDNILTMSGEKLLQVAGTVSRGTAIEKATTEYKNYQQKTLSEAEKNYLASLKILEYKSKHQKLL
jgi:hypothetical protein